MSNTDTKVWQSYLSMRFFQLIDWLKHEYSKRNNRFDRREGYEIIAKEDKRPFLLIDLYWLEDKHFE
ncbi:hypothetical protein [Bacillus atrophaeus]|uniref:hypothetical protein n=1 Tax=Bacillus atrophaeus TaxID=1452 RepID=UPI0012393B74|nr:hypothetical protein [Bacillus atrophaeus]KAA6447100.1 hypothetical protein DX926_16855 [Bacillus atrophaeus]